MLAVLSIMGMFHDRSIYVTEMLGIGLGHFCIGHQSGVVVLGILMITVSSVVFIVISAFSNETVDVV